MTAVVRLDGVVVRRGDAVLLDGVSWEIGEQDRWVVLGPNGAGKTTLMQVVAGRLFPTAGTVTLLGETLGEVDVFDLRSRIGLASAALAERIPPQESVRDVVVSAAYAVVGRWREQYDDSDLTRAEALLTEVGVADLAGRTFGTLSEGERKRVQIARSLMANPELLVLDEPLTGLDLTSAATIDELIHEQRDDGCTVILTTHDLDEARAADWVVLVSGRVVASGPPSTVCNRRNLEEAYGLGGMHDWEGFLDDPAHDTHLH